MPAPEVAPAGAAAAAAPGPRLVHEQTGSVFPLAAAGAETFIGRYDAATGIHPDIDLKPVDTDRSISRRHAKIVQHDNRYFVVEEIGTTNGTFVNRRRVEKGTEVEFRDGDEVSLGWSRRFSGTADTITSRGSGRRPRRCVVWAPPLRIA
jgi:pSer/pThr/pTyr-binding forkhead associated (FHA) protein